MNQYGVQSLFQKLNIKKLLFPKYYNELEFPNGVLVDSEGEFYISESPENYEEKYNEYPWALTGFYYYYDNETDCIVFEYRVEDTDVDSVDVQDRVFAIVPKLFLESYHIELDFTKSKEEEK